MPDLLIPHNNTGGMMPTKSVEEYKQEIHLWAEEQMRRPGGMNRTQVCDKLLKELDFLRGDYDLNLAKREVQHQLYSVMVSRNLKGKAFEKAKQLEKAIRLYEANVADGFEGSHPYSRLLIFYKRQKDYASAIRLMHVCSGLPGWDRAVCFQEIAKLTIKHQKQQSCSN